MCIPGVAISWCRTAVVKLLHLSAISAAPSVNEKCADNQGQAALAEDLETNLTIKDDGEEGDEAHSIPRDSDHESQQQQQQRQEQQQMQQQPSSSMPSAAALVSSLSPALQEFSRCVTELLKKSPGSKLEFDRFIPFFHRHFGKQCRVADYGFSKLLELLQAIPHVVRVLGAGNEKMLSLSHRLI